MAYIMYGCGLPKDHDPHWVTAAPEGGVGGSYCEGYAVDPPDMSLWLDFPADGVAPTEP